MPNAMSTLWRTFQLMFKSMARSILKFSWFRLACWIFRIQVMIHWRRAMDGPRSQMPRTSLRCQGRTPSQHPFPSARERPTSEGTDTTLVWPYHRHQTPVSPLPRLLPLCDQDEADSIGRRDKNFRLSQGLRWVTIVKVKQLLINPIAKVSWCWG